MRRASSWCFALGLAVANGWGVGIAGADDAVAPRPLSPSEQVFQSTTWYRQRHAKDASVVQASSNVAVAVPTTTVQATTTNGRPRASATVVVAGSQPFAWVKRLSDKSSKSAEPVEPSIKIKGKIPEGPTKYYECVHPRTGAHLAILIPAWPEPNEVDVGKHEIELEYDNGEIEIEFHRDGSTTVKYQFKH